MRLLSSVSLATISRESFLLFQYEYAPIRIEHAAMIVTRAFCIEFQDPKEIETWLLYSFYLGIFYKNRSESIFDDLAGKLYIFVNETLERCSKISLDVNYMPIVVNGDNRDIARLENGDLRT